MSDAAAIALGVGGLVVCGLLGCVLAMWIDSIVDVVTPHHKGEVNTDAEGVA